MTKTIVVVLSILITGCAAPVMLATSVSSVAVNETTGKTITDHVVSSVRQEDCRIARSLKGESMCQTGSNGGITEFELAMRARGGY